LSSRILRTWAGSARLVRTGSCQQFQSAGCRQASSGNDVDFHLVDQSTHSLLQLIAFNSIGAGAVVVQAQFFFTIPAERNPASFGDLQLNVADRLITVVRRSHTWGDVSCSTAGVMNEVTVCPTAARVTRASTVAQGMQPTSSRDTTSSASNREGISAVRVLALTETQDEGASELVSRDRATELELDARPDLFQVFHDCSFNRRFWCRLSPLPAA
jgi:hypothetical protein